MHPVYISHARGDPEWPDEDVDAVADRLEAAGLRVHLDLRFARESHAKPAPDAWERWMQGCLRSNPLVLCLCSATFAARCDRDAAAESGKGIARELLHITHRLSATKQKGDAWLWAATRDSADRATCVPGEIEPHVEPYRLFSELDRLVADLRHHAGARPQADGGGEGRRANRSGDAGDRGSRAGRSDAVAGSLAQQRHLAAKRLAEAPGLLAALRQDRWSGMPPPGVQDFDAATMASFLAQADPKQCDAALLATRRALRRSEGDDGHRLHAERAAVALYCLAACRRIEAAISTPEHARNGLVSVPNDANIYCAIISTALAGGELELRLGEDLETPHPQWCFEIHGAPTGDGSAHEFERALYCAVFPNAAKTPELARRCGPLSSDESAKLLARLNTVRNVNEESLTMVLRLEANREQAHQFGLANRLPLFVGDARMSRDFYGISAEALIADIREFWSSLKIYARQEGKVAAAAKAGDTGGLRS